MSWLTADQAVRTSSCAVPGCTGTASARNTLCPWHIANGTPDQYGAPRSSAESRQRRAQLRRDIRDLNRRIQGPPQEETLPSMEGERPRGPDGRRNTHVQGSDGSEQHRDGERWPNPEGRNARSVWVINTESNSFQHFAVFPKALVRRCIQAGTSERGACPECGTPVGWQHGCDHGDLAPVPAVVLDPFAGSGTTNLVSRNLGRHSIGIDLNADYLRIAADRLGQQTLLAENTA